jgi:hypothetical protein
MAYTGPAAAPGQRSVWWMVGILVGGTVFMALPVGALFVLASLAFFVGPAWNGTPDPGGLAYVLMLLGLTVLLFAFPLTLGLAVWRRRRGWWIWAAVTGGLTVAAVVLLGWRALNS